LSDFETDDGPPFGRWVETLDTIQGGSSSATIARIEGGAEGSTGALRVHGTVAAGAPYPWAGALFAPGDSAMSPVDLSAVEGFSLRTRGDGKTYRVMLF